MVAYPFPLNGTSSVGVSGSLDGILKIALFVCLYAPGVNRDIACLKNSTIENLTGIPDVAENLTSTLHVPDDAIVCPEQVSFRILNSEASVPVSSIVPITISAVPALVTVTVLIDDFPTFTERKLREGGLAAMSGIGASGFALEAAPVDTLPALSIAHTR